MHIKRVGYLAKKLEEQGVFVVASFLSPFRESREFVKKICGNFHEIHISTPLNICIQRDDSGVYEKAKEGKIKNLPGIDIEYELPTNGAMQFNLVDTMPADVAKRIFNEVLKSV
jgi:adenylylsulfate kinase